MKIFSVISYALASISLLCSTAVVCGTEEFDLDDYGVRVGSETIMKAPYELQMEETIVSHNGICLLKILRNGLLEVKRKIDGIFHTAWRSSFIDSNSSDDFVLRLHTDGNLAIHNSTQIVYETGFKEPLEVWRMGYSHSLKFDKMCRLYIEPFDDDYMGWENIRTEFTPMYSYLQKGDMYTDLEAVPPLTLHLQENCDLVIFQGQDLADKTYVLWASNTSNLSLSDCHVFGDWHNSKYTFGLYSGRFQPFFYTGRSNKLYAAGEKVWSVESNEYPYVHLTKDGPILSKVTFHNKPITN